MRTRTMSQISWKKHYFFQAHSLEITMLRTVPGMGSIYKRLPDYILYCLFITVKIQQFNPKSDESRSLRNQPVSSIPDPQRPDHICSGQSLLLDCKVDFHYFQRIDDPVQGPRHSSSQISLQVPTEYIRIRENISLSTADLNLISPGAQHLRGSGIFLHLTPQRLSPVDTSLFNREPINCTPMEVIYGSTTILIGVDTESYFRTNLHGLKCWNKA